MSGYPLLDVFWTILLFFCGVLWIFLIIWILIDIFRSPDIGGWAKAGWTLVVLLVPLIGVLAYEIVHSDHIVGWHDRYVSHESAKDEAYRASGGTSNAFELSKLADLHDRGVISDAEFERGKEEILGQARQSTGLAVPLAAARKRSRAVLASASGTSRPALPSPNGGMFP